MSPSLVVLTDFFAVSNRALSYAAALAMPLQAHLVLLHVQHDELLAPAEYKDYHSRQGEHHTAQALAKLAGTQPVPTEVDISRDFLPAAVAEVVHHHHPLLLVMGQPGAADASPELVTTTALDLLRHAPYPLLLVPAAGWDACPPRRLLLAVDGQPFHLKQLPSVVPQLLQATGSMLHVVHITTEGQDYIPTDDMLETLYDSKLVNAEAVPRKQVHGLTRASVAGGVLEEASRLDADMLVVVARHHSLLGSLFHHSVTAQLLRESCLPVLLLPAQD